MKKLLCALVFWAAMSVSSASAQSVDLGSVVVDKCGCSVTRNSDGHVFPLYGRVQVVDHSPDISVQIVDHSPDLMVQQRTSPSSCGEYTLVDHSPDIRVQIVDHSPDIRVEVVDHTPGWR